MGLWAKMKENEMAFNYHKMTIKPYGENFAVWKLKRRQCYGYATDMAGAIFEWFISQSATAKFIGSYEDCLSFIHSDGAEFMAMEAA